MPVPRHRLLSKTSPGGPGWSVASSAAETPAAGASSRKREAPEPLTRLEEEERVVTEDPTKEDEDLEMFHIWKKM